MILLSARKPMTPEAQKIEALLFLAGEAVPKQELKRLVEQPAEAVEGYLNEIAGELKEHGLALLNTPTHAQLATSSHVAEYLSQYLTGEAEEELSAAAAETLALIAYRGPLARAEVEAIRGVDSRRMVRQLLARDLVRKADPAARVARYIVTEEFLQRLGLTKAQELPDYETLSSHEKLEALLKKDEAI